MNVLTIPTPVLRQLLRTTGRQGWPVRCPVGVSRWGGHVELLAGPPGGTARRQLLLAVGDDLDPPRDLPPDCAGVLTLGAGHRRGQAQGFAHLVPGLRPIDRLKLV